MTSLAIFSGILVAVLLGAMSPGPSFVLISRTAVTVSRRDGVAAALGMGVGGAVFATLALVGLIAVLQQVEWLFVALKVCGGLYLLYLGIRIWRGAAEPLEIEGHNRSPRSVTASVFRSFWLGLATQIANPKTAVVYASIFAALLPSNPSWVLLVTLPPAILLVETGWYAAVAILFSASGPQRTYLRSKRWFDRIAGTVLGALGVRLIVEELR
jgi:threonine/homoserine/homoserine lactone efflux protein